MKYTPGWHFCLCHETTAGKSEERYPLVVVSLGLLLDSLQQLPLVKIRRFLSRLITETLLVYFDNVTSLACPPAGFLIQNLWPDCYKYVHHGSSVEYPILFGRIQQVNPLHAVWLDEQVPSI